ncbi:sigma 54 modulation/S30EA ribosomal C-terminal domain-containing protein [Phytohabitans sp. ZYX-F-186]|uniref:Sigma 54 modulation/S30EA ribosomal C-terminal domain-containing protein n=1 Tax=Phytohabitans maris TaxID=3071409 RepID=A0ABU0ZTQ7_9ACTN|nr:sigma 54 modulation/S30EA ribosomal C-terminal domain-containing protein [Phytohabitans sp. ZYX-F-186]MDQ7910421.1 sigma 54 modulation/S30EA ribosomal C-terminal domain-containing protein [Phytohabitans sp. ZYX-F-186]
MLKARTVPGPAAGVDVRVRGRVAPGDLDRAAQAVGAVVSGYGLDLSAVRVRLSGAEPALVQVNLRVAGAPARIQIPGHSVRSAIAAAATRLDRQIGRLTTAWQPWPWPDPERRTLGFPGPGTVVRSKAYRLHVGMPCQAASFMNAMDYDVMMYTDAETGEDAIVYRAGPTGLCLCRQRSMHPPSLPVTLPLTVNPRKVPSLTVTRAAARLAEGWLPFVFFTDGATGRGNLLYRRYDGDLGLIAPAAGNRL